MPDPHETLARIRKQANAATPGPWEWAGESGEMWPTADNSLMSTGGTEDELILYAWGHDAYGIEAARDEDAAFITSARTDVPWLLEQVELRDKALEAVLDLHKPGRTFHGHGFSQPFCTCGAPLPCPTATAATNALNGATP